MNTVKNEKLTNEMAERNKAIFASIMSLQGRYCDNSGTRKDDTNDIGAIKFNPQFEYREVQEGTLNITDEC